MFKISNKNDSKSYELPRSNPAFNDGLIIGVWIANLTYMTTDLALELPDNKYEFKISSGHTTTSIPEVFNGKGATTSITSVIIPPVQIFRYVTLNFRFPFKNESRIYHWIFVNSLSRDLLMISFDDPDVIRGVIQALEICKIDVNDITMVSPFSWLIDESVPVFFNIDTGDGVYYAKNIDRFSPYIPFEKYSYWAFLEDPSLDLSQLI